jgi:isoquinoline 1-oxidoreductase beta subunit
MTASSSTRMLTRRTILKATAAVGGGLFLSVSIPRLNAALAAEPNADFAPNAFIRIDQDSKVTFTIPQVEMGQGIYTALSMILADELDAPFDNVTAIAAPPDDKLYKNPVFGFQAAGGSTSVRAFWKPMRIAGAAPGPCWCRLRRRSGASIGPLAGRTTAWSFTMRALVRRLTASWRKPPPD